jgi:hypothetical protein
MAKPARYLSYLLRMWQPGTGQDRAWIASLERPGTRERQGFASLDDLFDFLRRQTCLPQKQKTAPPDEQAVNNTAEITDL